MAAKGNQGIVVIGLPNHAKALFWMGDFNGTTFVPDGFFPKGFELSTGEPYLVQLADQTTDRRRYSIDSLTIDGQTYGMDCGWHKPVFSVTAGQAQYYGDFSLVTGGDRLTLRQSFDIRKAQAYLDKVYPQQHWKLVPGRTDAADARPCPQGGGGIIFIQVPH